MADADEQRDRGDGGEPRVLQPAEGGIREPKVFEGRRLRQLPALREQGERRPQEQHHDHDRRDLHDAQGVVGRLVEAARVAPPEVQDDADRENGGEAVGRERQGEAETAEHLGRQGRDVQARGHGADRAREDVVEEQRRYRQLGHGAAHGLLHDPVDAAADEHHRALDVDRPDGPREEHDAEDEPGSRLADGLFRDAAGVEGRRSEIGQHDGGGPPKRNERQQDGGRHHHLRGLAL